MQRLGEKNGMSGNQSRAKTWNSVRRGKGPCDVEWERGHFSLMGSCGERVFSRKGHNCVVILVSF